MSKTKYSLEIRKRACLVGSHWQSAHYTHKRLLYSLLAHFLFACPGIFLRLLPALISPSYVSKNNRLVGNSASG